MKPIFRLFIPIILIVLVSICLVVFGDIQFNRLDARVQAVNNPVTTAFEHAVSQEQQYYLLIGAGVILLIGVFGVGLTYLFLQPIIDLSLHNAEIEKKYSDLQRDSAIQATQLQFQAYMSESERSKYEAIINSITEGMVITDTGGNVMMLNQPAQELLNIDPTTWYGRRLYDLLPLHTVDGSDIPEKKNPVYIALNYGQKIANDVMLDPTKDKRVIHVTSTVIITKDNQKIGSVTSMRDITHELEVDRMKTEFISLASHQLRTPLSAIRWFSEMLTEGDAGELTPEQTEFAKNIADSTHRMIDLVNSLLNISRIESGRIMIDPKPTNIRDLVTDIIQDLSAKINEKQHHVALSVHDDLPLVNLDARLIGQVYLNLLSNAIKYTPNGGDISVMISKKGDQLLTQISDNGFGIPLAEQSRMFEKFFRAQNVAKVETDGTGLGMYLVKAIITSSGGQIWFKSEEGKGTTFWFSLPLSGMQAKKGEVTLDS